MSSKKPLVARLTKLLTVHGAFTRSSSSGIGPSLVVSVTASAPGSVDAGPGCGGSTGLAGGSAVGRYRQFEPAAGAVVVGDGGLKR